MVSGSLSLTQQVALLEKKRAVLHGLTQVVISLERLRSALEAVLLLGGDREQLSESERRSVELIYERVRTLSDEALRQAIDSLDGLVRDSLQRLCALALELVDDVSARLDELERIHPQVNTFNRNARTAIALRVLLARRGQRLEPLALPLPHAEIAARLRQVDAQERQIRERVCRHVVDMRVDLAQLLANPACSPAQLQMFAELDASLTGNLEHILAGHSLAELPVSIEAVEVDRQQEQTESKPAASEPPEAERGADTGPQEVGEAAPQLSGEKRPGVLLRVRDWLSEPWNGPKKNG